MIEVDISHVWGSLSLPELLEVEKDIFTAHGKLADAMPEGMAALLETEVNQILEAAVKIRAESDICVIIGGGLSSLAARGAMALFQGEHRNLGKETGDPQIFFAGNSFSTRQWNELLHLLEGKDLSVVVLDSDEDCLESGIALRNIRWLLERRYGTDVASNRMYGAVRPGSSLHQMAQQLGWQHILLSGKQEDICVTAAFLLPMAAAGLDIREILRGIRTAGEVYDLRSFENPVWLHAGVRKALSRRGAVAEVLSYGEPSMAGFGIWWQQLFARKAGAEVQSLLPITAEFPAAQDTLGQMMGCMPAKFLETMIYFDPPQLPCAIVGDEQNGDGLNPLTGKELSFVDAQYRQTQLHNREDQSLPVITMDCGNLNPEKVGELLGFFLLSAGISNYAWNVAADPRESSRQHLLLALGCDPAYDGKNPQA